MRSHWRNLLVSIGIIAVVSFEILVSRYAFAGERETSVLFLLDSQRDGELLGATIAKSRSRGMTPRVVIRDPQNVDVLDYVGASKGDTVAFVIDPKDAGSLAVTLSRVYRASVAIVGLPTEVSRAFAAGCAAAGVKVFTVTEGESEHTCYGTVSTKISGFSLRGDAAAETMAFAKARRHIGHSDPIGDLEDDELVDAISAGKRIVAAMISNSSCGGIVTRLAAESSGGSIVFAATCDKIADNVVAIAPRCRMTTIARLAELSSIFITDSLEISGMCAGIGADVVLSIGDSTCLRSGCDVRGISSMSDILEDRAPTIRCNYTEPSERILKFISMVNMGSEHGYSYFFKKNGSQGKIRAHDRGDVYGDRSVEDSERT